MNSLKNLLVIGTLAITVLGFSESSNAEVRIDARAYRGDCSYYSSSSGDFKIFYQNYNIPANATIRVVYGFTDRFKNQLWVDQGTLLLGHTGNNQWLGEIGAKQVDARGSYFYDEIEFAFEIFLPDGGSFWDNGGRSVMGYYVAPIPERSCGIQPEYRRMPVNTRS